ncbi:RHS repeat-associated core domain-containing protein, partial [Chromobacterium sp. F49]|uniref:RHS repeat-associated core domain-containing protein n=4 Tax=Chromobacterium TaxID=535 RepID=UPI0018D49282
NRHRYYDPEIGRFISRDPIGLMGGINIYDYAPNPLNWLDPLGLSSTVLNKDLGGVVGDKMQAHHVIPEEIWGKKKSFLDAIGYQGQRDKAPNGVLLPDSQKTAQTMGKKVYHCGSHANYSQLVEEKLSRIQNRYESGAITADQAKNQVSSLQISLRKKINSGRISTKAACGRLN